MKNHVNKDIMHMINTSKENNNNKRLNSKTKLIKGGK